MQRIFILLFFLLTTLLAIGQRATVKGILRDTISRQPVANATISLLQKKDSSLVSFTMADNDGRFEINGVSKGDYRLMITHINYHNANKTFRVDSTKEVDLGSIAMTDLSKVLDEVVVTNDAPPVTLVGDTVQYNAGSFKTQPNANVEDLLKKLPGVKVEKDGTVKAQGEKVSRVLVDGKEFFGNDPKIATKNLPADVVDKVQVYDKMSDQASLTGFDDGNSEKTINLKLKKDKKKGYFGKVNAGAGTNERYQGRANINSFKGARQMSAIAMANNTNAEGFSVLDILNFTGELKRMMSGGGGNININISDDDPNSMLAGGNSGINTIWAGGLNYNNIIGNKTDFTSNYFYNRYNPNKESHIQRQYFLPDSSYLYNQNSFSDNINNNHRLNLSADFQIDSFHSIKVSPSFSYQKTSNNTRSDYETLSEERIKSNDGYSNSTANNEGYNFRTDILFRKKFRRKGRTLSLALQTTINDNEGSGTLESLNSFYNSIGDIIRRDTTNQQSMNESNLTGFTGRLVYTEPIFKKSLLEFSAGKGNTKNVSNKATYDYNSDNGKFDKINDRLSNDYENTYGYTNAGIKLRKQAKKYSYAMGLAWQNAELAGKIISGNKDSVIGKSFTNLLPNARFQYNFSRSRNLRLNYSTFTNQPTASQLQPVPDNSNTLNIKEGNPDLKQEYTHALQANLFIVNPYKNRNLFVFLNLQKTQNKIVNYDSLDNFGIKTTKPVNVNGVYDLNGDINWGFPVRFLKATMSLGSRLGYYKGKQFINTVQNNISNISAGPTLRLDMSPNDKLQVSVTAGSSYNYTTYSLQSALNTTYFSQEYGADINWQLPWRIYFATDFTYSINSQRAAGFNTKVPFWNASISRQVLRFNRGEIKFGVNDLLNQNIGINRTTNQNYIEDSRVRTLRRFFLLSFTYSLTKTGLNNAGGGGNMKIITR
ncbi:MAG: outer membrane beta-barrel protein [Chitinophagaceae bacterium]|nr:outer membrane beta-barrel protein [Chitinophagaceae bacterium]